MNPLFVDTSVMVALASGEPGHRQLSQILESATDVFASPLREAELGSALAREEVADAGRLLDGPLSYRQRRGLPPQSSPPIRATRT